VYIVNENVDIQCPKILIKLHQENIVTAFIPVEKKKCSSLTLNLFALAHIFMDISNLHKS